jgi:hypothetical protein
LANFEFFYSIFSNFYCFSTENALKRTGDVVLKELKRVFDNAIHPLESMYKYRDLSNRHFGDPEIFSKPLVLFMGPWSGGKSTILNYLTDNEYTPNSIRSGEDFCLFLVDFN